MSLVCTGVRQNRFSQQNYNEIINYLHVHLLGKLIDKEGDIARLQRSPDPALSNFVSWGHLKR